SEERRVGKECRSRRRGLAHIDTTLNIGCLVKPSLLEQYNQELKKLEENLTSLRDVSEANGFAREALESDVLLLWKSLFEGTISQVLKPDNTIIHELLRPLLNEVNKEICARSLASLVIKPFFSSRRRHTIFSRDWSSDVCSSD